jgi:hypothetical protein
MRTHPDFARGRYAKQAVAGRRRTRTRGGG